MLRHQILLEYILPSTILQAIGLVIERTRCCTHAGERQVNSTRVPSETNRASTTIVARIVGRRVISALSTRQALTFYGSTLVIDLLLFGVVFTALPFMLNANFGLLSLLIGLVLTAGELGSTVAATQNGRLAWHLSDSDIIAIGFIATAIALGGAWLAPSPYLIAIWTIGFGAGWGLTLPSIDAGVCDIVRTQYRAAPLRDC